MKETLIDLIRHGEPEGGSRYRGSAIDDPLSEKGWQQMWSSIGDHSPWDQIISSPLIRCRAFAEAVADKYAIPVSIIDNLKEIGFGSWEGKTRDEVKQFSQEEYDAFYRDPVNARPQGAEDLDKFVARVTGAYETVVAEHQGKHCLIVAHAGVNRVLVAYTLQAGPAGIYRMEMDNGGISRIRHKRYGAMLEFHNKKLDW